MISAPERSLNYPFGDELVIEERENLVHIRLNRPAALNALSAGMIKGLGAVLDMAGERTVLVSGEGRAFCAGGDIKAQVQALRTGDLAGAQAYFQDEYRFNARLFHHVNDASAGRYVSYLNGIVMGGGYGISAHGSHLVTCEHTAFAMPEVKIGFFPDVGAAYHLARVRGELGTYMALTGNTVGAADMLYMGLAHGHVPTAQAGALRQALEADHPTDAIARLNVPPAGEGILRRHEEVIARCFAHDDALAIVDALKTDGSAFAVEAAADIEARSPTSVRVALAHIRRAGRERFDQVIARDLHLARRFLTLPDFTEGVRAAVIDKDRNPGWKPAHLTALSGAEAALYLES